MKKFKKQLRSEAAEQLCHPELVSGSEPTWARFRNKFGMTSKFAKQTITSLLSCLPAFLPSKIKVAFTLAETLITLGIIGIVAALTMPALISNHNKHVTETKLKHFYSNINQAIKLSEIDNGSVETWYIPDTVGDIESAENFYNQYLAKYLKTIGTGTHSIVVMNDDKTEVLKKNDYFYIKFPDGSAMIIVLSKGVDIDYFTKTSNLTSGSVAGKNRFAFSFRKSGTKGNINMVEPYTFDWDGTKEHLISHPRYGCSKTATNSGYCAKLIQMNGWKIPDDYPIKF